ncbi:MAG: SpoIIE family protein phosphatase [Bacteroidales bacterium]
MDNNNNRFISFFTALFFVFCFSGEMLLTGHALASNSSGIKNDSLSELNLRIGEYERSGNRSGLVDALTAKAKFYYKSDNYEDALINANQALIFAYEVGREQQTEIVYRLLAEIHFAKDLIWESTEYLYNGYKLSQAIRDTAKITWYMLSISQAEEYLGRFSDAMDINLNAIEFFKTTGDSLSLAKIYRAQGVVHTELGNNTTAQSYLEKAIALLGQYNDSLNIGLAYLSLSNLEIQRDKLFEAQNDLNRSMKSLKSVSPKYYNRCQTYLGVVNNCNRKYSSTIDLLTGVAQEQMVGNDRYGLSLTFSVLGDAYHLLGNSVKAVECYNRCLKVAREGNLNNFIRRAYKGLAKIYGQSGQQNQAYAYLSRYVSITDSLFNQQKISEANRLENQALIRLKEKEISAQKEQLISNSEKLEQEKQKQTLLVIILVLAFGVILFAFREFQHKKRANTLLTEQKTEIERQKNMLENRTKDITDSLNYARRIQKAILHSAQQPEDFFQDSFLIFLPKELVSGDFYWLKMVDNQILFAVADCTGHGAPGAFMSIIGTFGLNHIVSELGETHPGEVLNQLNELFHNSFEQREGAEIFDGMDVGFCNYNPKTRELKFAGANIYLHVLRKAADPAPSSVILQKSTDYTLYQVKCDKQSIGYFLGRSPFSTHSVQLLEGDCLYIFTDGYTDQFGGPNGKKFRYNELRTILCGIATLPMNKQKDHLMESFAQWKGSNVQVDDVTFLGIRIP